ncbi:MAG: 5-dehydro-4-deoxy-D-glucuronate isomerase, partial [Candidatus Marinimicrobia bacterium]|nr:5-dehydro-4-deoxy-D-glucuronate isomerase [Candidatus Neomarinimicrobiota bacterium]
MEVRYLADPVRFQRMTTAELRQNLLVENLFNTGELRLVYSNADRAIVGSAVPLKQPLALSGSKELAAEYFTERREVG